MLEIKNIKNFASDNNSGCLPEVLEFVQKVNRGHMHAYGADDVSKYAKSLFKKHFGENAEVFFVFNGTAANVVGLKAMLKSYESVICADTSHIHNDECAAPEAIGGFKLITLPTANGKLTLDQIKENIVRGGDQHFAQTKVVSITQPTELGTCYTSQEIKEMASWLHQHHMYLHVDGSRLVNAVYTQNSTFKDMITDAGVDVLSFGGSKNGTMLGEAVVFLNKSLAKDFKYIRKQFLQLPGKARFISAQFIPLLEGNLWRTTAEHSCNMAKYFASELKKIKEIEITQEVQSNAVFVKIPKPWNKKLREKYYYYIMDEKQFVARLMCSFDTTKEDINNFMGIVKGLRS